MLRTFVTFVSWSLAGGSERVLVSKYVRLHAWEKPNFFCFQPQISPQTPG